MILQHFLVTHTKDRHIMNNPKRVVMVGAGGIGVVLWEIIRGFQYAETCAVMLIIIVTVSVIDVVSARIRQFFV